MADESEKNLIVADESEKKVILAEEPEKKVILRSNDHHEFVIEESLAKESKPLMHLIDDINSPDNPVTLPNVDAVCLAKIIEYWRANKSGNEDEVKKLDRTFSKMERNELFDLVNATNYLDTKPLFDALCSAIADNIKNMTVECVRDYFCIENDFTPEEEAALRKENEWAFD